MADVDLLGAMTLGDLAAMEDSAGNFRKLAEVLTNKVQLYEDMLFVPSNAPTYHEFQRRTYLPTGSWGRINKGNAIEATHTAVWREDIGQLISWSQIDERLLKKYSNRDKARTSMDMGFIAGLGMSFAESFIYETLAEEPDAFPGIRARYNDLSLGNVHNGGAAGGDAASSIYVIYWNEENGVYVAYPPDGEPGGVRMDPRPRETITDTVGPYDVYRTKFTADGGLCVADDDACQVIVNVDLDDTDPTSNDLYDVLVDALVGLPAQDNAVIYMHRKSLALIRKLANDKVNVKFDPNSPMGRGFIADIDGVPVKIIDEISIAESIVS